MRPRLRHAGVGLALAIIATLGLMVFMRLVPSDPADWHIDMAAPGFAPDPGWATFCPVPGARFAPSDVPGALDRLDMLALATPNTTRLAGSPADGHVTWLTRSTVMGYPDYTTAQILDTADGPRLCIVARQRFGVLDFGVNADRITGWMQEVLGLLERPPQVPF
jgi:hypothetical protein